MKELEDIPMFLRQVSYSCRYGDTLFGPHKHYATKLRHGQYRKSDREVGILRDARFFFCTCKVEMFFFYPMAGNFFFNR